LLPRIALVGSSLVLALPLLARLTRQDTGLDAAKGIRSVDIFAIAARQRQTGNKKGRAIARP